MQIIKRKLLFVLLLTPLVGISANTPIQKYFKQQKFSKILTIINEHKNDKIKDAEDHRICGETSYMFGMYKESCFYFEKVESMNARILKEEDLIHYAFSLMKTGEYNLVLNKTCFNSGITGFWLKHLVNVARLYDSYREKISDNLTQKPIDIRFLSQYGVDYFDQSVYYSFPRFTVENKGMLSENALINNRRNELSGIRKTTISENGITGSSEIIEKKLAGAKRIATMQIIDVDDNFVSTVVAQRGKPEQIVIHGKLLPGFPFNSKNHACAMPYFDKKTQRLYFCSDMNGGIGGWDIYFTKLENEKWQKPVNLGDKVNTPFDELFPSVFDDLLIFSSEAREGLGGFDNYAFSFSDSSAINLWPFNTIDDDLSLKFIRKEGVQAVGVDLSKAKFFQSELKLDALLNPAENEVEEDEVTIRKPMIAENLQTDTITKKEQNLVVSNFVPNEISSKTDLSQISIDGDILLGKIYYDLNSAVFHSIDYAKLDSIASLIRRNGTKNIIIWSFTDRCGAEKYNGNLSYQRALGIAEYLKSKFTKEEDKVYFSVAAGEYYTKTKSKINMNERRADIFSSEKGLPFQIVYAYKPNPGETAKMIAKTFNNDYEMMSQLNIRTSQGHKNDEIVFVGIQGIHVTSPGESLYGISLKYKCSLTQLLEANHKTKNSLLVAEKLVIPLPSTK